MGMKSATLALLGIILLLVSIPEASLAKKIIAGGSIPEARLAKKFIVGGSEHWRYGFNYMEWAFKSGPFYQNDSLVYMYDPPNSTTPPHSVYLLKNYRSFLKCDFRNATLVGNVIQGGGQGVEFVLKERKPHFFACAEHSGIHCRDGLMRFFVYPLKNCHH